MKLIIKADDFGSTPGVTEGIIRSMKEGLVTDTSMLVNSPHFDYAVKRANEEGIKAVGLHLALTYRKPLLDKESVATLIDDSGMFHRRIQNIPQNLSLKELEEEFRAQIEKFMSSGLILSHIDSHHHVHRYLGKDVGILVAKLAKEYNVPLRRPNDDVMEDAIAAQISTTDILYEGYGGTKERSEIEPLISYLDTVKDQDISVEIMTHPGYVDEELKTLSSWTDCREEEILTLTSDALKKYIKDNNIEMISFLELEKANS